MVTSEARLPIPQNGPLPDQRRRAAEEIVDEILKNLVVTDMPPRELLIARRAAELAFAECEKSHPQMTSANARHGPRSARPKYTVPCPYCGKHYQSLGLASHRAACRRKRRAAADAVIEGEAKGSDGPSRSKATRAER